jgi:hypothetical protein
VDDGDLKPQSGLNKPGILAQGFLDTPFMRLQCVKWTSNGSHGFLLSVFDQSSASPVS